MRGWFTSWLSRRFSRSPRQYWTPTSRRLRWCSRLLRYLLLEEITKFGADNRVGQRNVNDRFEVLLLVPSIVPVAFDDAAINLAAMVLGELIDGVGEHQLTGLVGLELLDVMHHLGGENVAGGGGEDLAFVLRCGLG